MTVPPVPLAAALGELAPRLRWDAEQLAAHRRDALTATLRHAVRHSPFHRARLADGDVDGVSPDDLTRLPTMSKTDVMANWDRLVTDERLDLALARRHLERVDAGGPLVLHDHLVLTSGGSTGEPGVFCWSLAEMARWGASTLRWSAVGGPPPAGRTAWVAARSLRHPSAVAALLASGDPRCLVPIDQPVDDIVAALDALQPDALSVVCSMLPALTAAKRDGRLRADVRAISVFGDVLPDGAATDCHDAFGVWPTEGYPTTDVGHIAQQAPGEHGMYVNDDLLVVEAVDADERPVAAGVACDHLLVTSLHQRTMPMIRYRIDDRVVMDGARGRLAAYSRIASVDGRRDDVLRYGDVAVHPHVFRTVLTRHGDVHDYEIHQTPSGASVRVAAPATFDHACLAGELVDALRAAGLRDADVDVIVSGALARTAVGKRRHVVPLEPTR